MESLCQQLKYTNIDDIQSIVGSTNVLKIISLFFMVLVQLVDRNRTKVGILKLIMLSKKWGNFGIIRKNVH